MVLKMREPFYQSPDLSCYGCQQLSLVPCRLSDLKFGECSFRLALLLLKSARQP